MNDFRNSRIGVRNASLMIGVTVTELREAVLGEKPIKGVMPPQPIFRSGVRQSEMVFLAGDVMDMVEKIKASASSGS